MMVDDSHDFRLLQAIDCLGQLVVVDQNHFLAFCHGFDQLGQGQTILVEVPFGFRRQGAQADGLVFAGFAFGLALGHFIHVESQAHSCGNGIVVGVLVTHDDDGFCHVFSFVSLGEGAIGALPFFAILRF